MAAPLFFSGDTTKLNALTLNVLVMQRLSTGNPGSIYTHCETAVSGNDSQNIQFFSFDGGTMRVSRSSLVVLILLAALFSIIGVHQAVAQGTGSISGTVADVSSATVGGSQVTLTNTGTGQART